MVIGSPWSQARWLWDALLGEMPVSRLVASVPHVLHVGTETLVRLCLFTISGKRHRHHFFPQLPRPGLCVRGREPDLRADRFGAVFKVVRTVGSRGSVTGIACPRCVRALGDLYPLCDSEESCMEVLSVSRSTFLRVADSATHQVTPRASGVRAKFSSPPALARGDHPHFEPSQRGSLQKALWRLSLPLRDGTCVLQQADSLTIAASTKGNRDYLWKTWVTIATAWGVPPLPLTPTPVHL